MRTGTLFSTLAIRDTNAHVSSTIQTGGYDMVLFATSNTLNQDVSLLFEGSFDGTTWFSLKTAATIAATTGKAVDDLSMPWPKLRATATCSVSPASGSFTIWWSSHNTSGIV